MNKLLSLMVLLYVIVISGCASTRNKDSYESSLRNCLNNQTMREAHTRFPLDGEKDYKKYCEKHAKNVTEYIKSEEFVKDMAEYRKTYDLPAYKPEYQPSYDPNTEINRLKRDLTTQSIINNAEIMKMEQDRRRLESEQSYSVNIERAREQQRQIEQFNQETNRQREMHKLRMDNLLIRGIY